MRDLMDCETAAEHLNAPEGRCPSELGEAVQVLYAKYGNYNGISSRVPLSADRLSDLHRVFRLPEGIRWQVDQGRIRVGHARQISRLEGEQRWLLAFAIVEEGMSVKECKAVVDAVVKKQRPLDDVLRTLAGIRFEKVKPLMLPLSFEDRFAIIRAAWSKKLHWPDFSLRAIEEATRVDLEQIARELAALADQLRPRCIDGGGN